MKKLLYSILILVLFSCSKLDKTIDDNYAMHFQELRDSNLEYSINDFNRAMASASKLLSDASLSEDDPKGITIQVTYKELLDQAKQDNKNDSIDAVEYDKQKSLMDRILSVDVVEYTFTEDLFNDKIIENRQPGLEIILSIQNNSGKEIKSFVGRIEIKSLNEKLLYSFDLSREGEISAKSEFNFTDKYIVNVEKHNAMLKTATVDSLEFVWIPSKIIFEDNKELILKNKE